MRVHFTRNLLRHGAPAEVEAEGATVRDVLRGVFALHPRLASYVVDDQGALRKHMNVFIDGRPVSDRRGLGDAVSKTSEIHVMQALSGG